MPLHQRPSAANEGRKTKDAMSEKPATKGVSIKVTPVNGDPRSDQDQSDRENKGDRRGRGGDRGDIRKPGESSRSRSRSRTRTKSQDGEEEASYEDKLRDALRDANTELNKTNSEKDRYKSLYDQTAKKLSEHTKSIFDLKTQIQAMKDDNTVLKEKVKQYAEENDRLTYEVSACETDYTELKARYENLLLRYNATNIPSPDNPMTSAAASSDRAKAPRTPSKRDSGIRGGDERDTRGRGPRDRDEKKEQEKRDRKEAERRERKEAEKEQKAEKERLSRRFEDRTAEPSRRPPTRKRDSYADPAWSSSSPAAPVVNGGSSGNSRSTSTNPSSRKYGSGGMSSGRSHRPSPDMSPTHGYSNVPRTSNPMSPGGMYSNPGSASGGSAAYDEDYDDGNYHPYPITR